MFAIAILIFLFYFRVSCNILTFQDDLNSEDFIDEYHFPMLNDLIRNNAYEEALRLAINPKSRVLDVGSGTMLLSMMSARLGATKVLGVERDFRLVKIAKEILELNHYNSNSNTIQLFSGDLSALRVGSKYLKEPANILVSETLDCLLIGEGFLKIIMDSKENGLITPDATIIPNHGSIFFQLLETIYSLSETSLINGFNINPIRNYRRMNYHFVNEIDSHITKQKLSHISTAFEFNFQNLQLNDTFGYKTIIVNITKSGHLNAIGFWFEVSLDSNRTILLNNSPGTHSHWMQKIFIISSDRNVYENELITIQLVHLSGNIIVGSIEKDARLIKIISKCPFPVTLNASSISHQNKNNEYYLGQFIGTNDFDNKVEEEYNVFQSYVNQQIRGFVDYNDDYHGKRYDVLFKVPSMKSIDIEAKKLPPLYVFRLRC